MTVDYPRRLRLAQTPTPLQPLDRLSEQLNASHKPVPRIWIKRDDMTGSSVSGNKIRKLEFTLAKAIDEGFDTIITCGGVQSNHCRTTAILCAQLGLQCHLILRGDADSAIDGNLLLDKLVGAKLSFYDNREYQQRSDEIFQHWVDHYAANEQRAIVIPVGASDGHGLWGYIAACEELKNDFAAHSINPKHIIAATGSGGTQAGLTVGSDLHDLNAKVWGINVCDDEQYFLDKVAQDIDQWQDWYSGRIDSRCSGQDFSINVIDGYVGQGYSLADEKIFTLIQQVACLEGIILDPVYTAKAFYGMLEEIKQQRFADSEDIVFVHTGGLFGLFPQKQQLQL